MQVNYFLTRVLIWPLQQPEAVVVLVCILVIYKFTSCFITEFDFYNDIFLHTVNIIRSIYNYIAYFSIFVLTV